MNLTGLCQGTEQNRQPEPQESFQSPVCMQRDGATQHGHQHSHHAVQTVHQRTKLTAIAREAVLHENILPEPHKVALRMKQR